MNRLKITKKFFSQLLNKFAPPIAIYLNREVNIILKAFLVDICGLPEKPLQGDCE